METPQVKSLEDKMQELLKGYSFTAVVSALTTVADEMADSFMNDGMRTSVARGKEYHRLAGALDATFRLAEAEGL